MSVALPHTNLSSLERSRLERSLTFRPKVGYIQKRYVHYRPQPYYAFSKVGPYYVLPFHFSWSLKQPSEPGWFPQNQRDFSPYEYGFSGVLRPIQREVAHEVIPIIRRQHCAVLALYCGSGKTCLALYLAARLKLKLLVIVHRTVLVRQWQEACQRFLGVKAHLITPKKPPPPDCVVGIINGMTVEKMGSKPFLDFGFVVYDECHVAPVRIFSRSLFYLFPRYLLGLSATPERPDGMEKMLYQYFGPNIVERRFHREFYVLMVETGFEPTIEMVPGKNGKPPMINWSMVLNSLAASRERNKLIAAIACFFPLRNMLILSKRKKQCRKLSRRLTNSTVLIGSTKTYDEDARIILSTYSKAGVGFDNERLDMLMLCCDVVEGLEQNIGRVFRNEFSYPLIIDFVDNNTGLQRHWLTRAHWYQEHGGHVYRFTDLYGADLADFRAQQLLRI